ncbi:hypothetical protein [Tunturiibacter gelidiferens]|uniref:hypothetical protein n=1 Tax=Tunturiibacter gelidiferens TaxID=3069689 RepID=UPI00333F61A7
MWRRWESPSDRDWVSQYCPVCLRQSGHHQLSWTIGVYSCCVQHRCFLQQKVSSLQKVISSCAKAFQIVDCQIKDGTATLRTLR